MSQAQTPALWLFTEPQNDLGWISFLQPSPGHGQGQPPPEQAAPSPVQPAPENRRSCTCAASLLSAPCRDPLGRSSAVLSPLWSQNSTCLSPGLAAPQHTRAGSSQGEQEALRSLQQQGRDTGCPPLPEAAEQEGSTVQLPGDLAQSPRSMDALTPWKI